MQNNLHSLILLLLILSLSSCATYRNGQTPDDIYHAEEVSVDQYVLIPSDPERDRNDREIRTQFFNPRFSGFNNTFWGNPSFPLFHQPHVIGFGNNAILPFQPQTPSRFRPQISTASPQTNNPVKISETKSSGKLGWYSSGESSNSNSNSTQQSGSRYFSENSGSTPSSPRSSGNGGTRSGRRN